jgi:branched-chain amino acid transport system ATP-binding protein
MTSTVETPLRQADLVLEGVDTHYGSHAALIGVDLVVPAGSCVAVLGSNGSGKSTLLNSIAGLVPTTRGSVSLGADRIDGLPAHKIARRGVCYVPEGRGVFPDLTVLENLAISIGSDEAKRDVVFGYFPALEQRARRLAGTMSGGEQQMLAVAPAIVGEYSVLMLDELSLGLAPLVVEVLYDALVTSRHVGSSMLIVEQFAERALALADVAYVLRKGRVVFHGPAADLAADPDALHALYIGGRDS